MCNCIETMTTKLYTHYDGKFKKPVVHIELQTGVDFKAGCLVTYSDVDIRLKDQKKTVKSTVLHTYCPFCGVLLRDKEG
jgi:hypothetical protein